MNAKPEANKTQMIREAIDALGFDASREAIVKWIFDKHQVEVDKQYVSTTKQNLKTKYANVGKPKTVVTRSEPVYMMPLETTTEMIGNIPVREIAELIAAVKTANRAIGKDAVQQIVDATNT